ncbi:MAG: 1,4-alpha-glucan branching enzyme, partial [Propionibacterium sp.]
ENFILPISHDEVVHGKGSMINKVPQDDWRKFATLRAFYAFMWSFPGKQLIFMGQEFGQRPEFNETTSLEWWVSDLWGHGGLQRLFRDLNITYRSTRALYELDSNPAGFEWLNANDATNNVFCWLRRDSVGGIVACLVNFSPEPQHSYQVGLPKAGIWREILNTDSLAYDGSGEFGNLGQVTARSVPSAENSLASATISIPPLGAVWLTYDPVATAAQPGDLGIN